MVDIARAAREAGTVRKARTEEAGRLAAVLARSFYDDPPISWVINDGRRRLALLERSFALYLRKLWLEQDETYTTAEVAGVCVWEAPGQWKVGILDQLRLLPSMARIYGRILPRVLSGVATPATNHPRDPPHPLPSRGADPPWRGRGLGAALMRPVLDRCDSEGGPAYLEASAPRNRALYE